MIGVFLGTIAAIAMSQQAHADLAVSSTLQPLIPSAAVAPPAAPRKRNPDSLGVRTSGASAFVADIATGSVLYAKDPHRIQPIASLTKLVTAMVFLDLKPDMKKIVVVESGDFDGEGKPVFKPGDRFTNGELLSSMLVGSVNASANAIARSTLGREAFVAAMNDKVKQMGLKSPVFVDPSGVDPGNRANAADVAAIISAASGHPEIRSLAGTPELVLKAAGGRPDYHVKSTNLLLGSYLNRKPYGIIAAKTGSLPEAGFCMAQVTRNEAGHEIVAVELGSSNHFSRFQDIKALTTWAFDTYSWDK